MLVLIVDCVGVRCWGCCCCCDYDSHSPSLNHKPKGKPEAGWIRLTYRSKTAASFWSYILDWVLLVVSFVPFWPCQKTGFEASELNKGALHAPTACNFTLGASCTIRVAAFLALAPPSRALLLSSLPCSQVQQNAHKKAISKQEDGGI